MKAKYRIRNWAKYNENLKERGSTTLRIDEDVLQAWKPTPEAVRLRGGQKQYTEGGSSKIKNTKLGEPTLTCESNL